MDAFGAKRIGRDITISGVYDDRTFWPTSKSQAVTIVLVGRRAFWTSWYPERYVFQADVVFKETETLTQHASFHPTSPITVQPAEHWRRAGYFALNRLARMVGR